MEKFQWDMDELFLVFVKRNKLPAVVEKVIKEGLNVRQLEQFIQQLNEKCFT